LPPADAPELHPNEYGWSHLKCGTFANFRPHDLDELEAGVFVAAVGTQGQETLLRMCGVRSLRDRAASERPHSRQEGEASVGEAAVPRIGGVRGHQV